MKDHDRLLRDVLGEADGGTLREASLAGMLGAARRRRTRRVCARGAGICAVLVLAAALAIREAADRKEIAAREAGGAETARGVKIITEEELLALFKDRPVALIGEPGNQRLIFLDEIGGGSNL